MLYNERGLNPIYQEKRNMQRRRAEKTESLRESGFGFTEYKGTEFFQSRKI